MVRRSLTQDRGLSATYGRIKGVSNHRIPASTYVLSAKEAIDRHGAPYTGGLEAWATITYATKIEKTISSIGQTFSRPVRKCLDLATSCALKAPRRSMAIKLTYDLSASRRLASKICRPCAPVIIVAPRYNQV